MDSMSTVTQPGTAAWQRPPPDQRPAPSSLGPAPQVTRAVFVGPR